MLLIDISVAIVSTKIPVLLGMVLGFLADETPAVRFLEHDARGTDGFFHVAWLAVLAHRRRWEVVIRRRDNTSERRLPRNDGFPATEVNVTA